MSKIVLIDLSAIFWRLWHVTKDKEFSEARTKTVSMVESMLNDGDYCGICIDAPPYKRSEIYPEYKAGRERSESAVEELKGAINSLKAHGVPCYWSKGYEADDIIGTLSKQALSQGLEVLIYGSDKDLLQIEGVTITDPFERKQLSAMEKFGVPAELVAESLALTGDTSDNVPGVPGVGPKKAASIIEHIGVENFLSGKYSAETFAIIPEAVKKALVENHDKLQLSYELVKLYYDAPVTLKLNEAVKKPEEASKEMSEQLITEPEITEKPIEENAVQVVKTSDIAIHSDNRNANWSLALEPSNTAGALKLAQILHTSRLFGQFANPEAVLAVLLRGRALGVDATTALSSFHVIKGKPVMHATLIVGLVLKSKCAEYFDLVESTDEKATWATKRVNGRREVIMSFTIQDAEKAGLLNGGKDSNWFKYRKAMLRHRASTELARAVYPDVTTGLYTEDEISNGQMDI